MLQEDYEEMYIGPEFLIDQRYSIVMCIAFTVMTYGIGMPLMYPIGMMFMISVYWVDKYLFLRFYRKPPMYDVVMNQTCVSIFNYSIVIHGMISLYVFSNDNNFG